MADIKNITIDGTTYDLKDDKARNDITDLKEDLNYTDTEIGIAESVGGTTLNIRSFVDVASNTNVRFSANPTSKSGLLKSITLKLNSSGSAEIVYGTYINGIYKYVGSINITASAGVKTYYNGMDFTYNLEIPKNAIFGIKSTDVSLYYLSGDTSLNLTTAEASNTSGIAASTMPYGVSIKYAIISESRIDKLEQAVFYIKDSYSSRSVGTLTGTSMMLNNNPPSAIKKNLALSFFATVQSFDFMRIRYVNTAGTVTYDGITFDNTNVTVSNVDNSSVATYPHGLNIINNVAILIKMNIDETADITIMSDGDTFTRTVSWFRMIDSTTPQVIVPASTTLKDCTLSWQSEDINKETYIYGDSYINYMPERWLYYAEEYGYTKNMQINGFPGASSAKMLACLKEDLKHGTPKYILWSLGMNDTSDSGTTPAPSWLAAVQEVETICENINAKLILATVPTVATNGTVTRNNEGKNNWVKASGYQYIDFADAVGAGANGVWYDGMLEPTSQYVSERVHPTIKGAKALFMKACTDFPQMMIKN